MIIFDLDDPTIFIGRIVRQIEALLAEPGNTDKAVDVYACSTDTSAKVRKKVAAHKLFFLPKPLTVEKCTAFAKKYPPMVAPNTQL